MSVSAIGGRVAIIIIVCLPLAAAHAAGTRDARTHPTLSARELLSVRDIGGYSGVMSISPSGRLVAFQLQQADFAENTYRSAWYVSSTAPHAIPRRIADGGDIMLAAAFTGMVDGAREDVRAQWSPDEQWIAYLRRDGDRIEVWRARVDGTRSERVTTTDAVILRFAWRRDGRGIYFLAGRNRADMARADREEGENGYLLDDRFSPAYSTRPLWFRCGGDPSYAPVPPSERCEPTLWTVSFGKPAHEATAAQARMFHELTARDLPSGIDAARDIRALSWNADHTRAAWLENVSPKAYPGPAAPLTLFADDRRCPAGPCEGPLAGVWWRGGEVIFLAHGGWARSVPTLYRWRPGGASVERIYAVDGTLRSCGMAVSRLLCLLETPKAPRKIISIDLDDGRIETVFDPNPEFGRYALGRVEKLEVTDGLGNRAFGHLVYPPDYDARRRYPLVIVQYRSRGFLRGGTGNEYPIYPLAAAGFLVYSSDNPQDLRIDARYPGHDRKSFLAYSRHEFGRSGYRMRRVLGAFDNVLDRLECRGIVDASRVGITGLSAGAEALYFALIHSNRFAAAATSGLGSPESESLIVSDAKRAVVKAAWEARTLPQAIATAGGLLSFTRNLDRIRTPLLLQVPDRELLDDLPDYVALEDAGRPVEAYVFPDEYHVKYQPLHKLAAGERAIDWFRFWLMGEEDPTPRKAQQYARWEVLRRKAADLGGRSTRAPRSPRQCRREAAEAARASAHGRGG